MDLSPKLRREGMMSKDEVILYAKVKGPWKVITGCKGTSLGRDGEMLLEKRRNELKSGSRHLGSPEGPCLANPQ